MISNKYRDTRKGRLSKMSKNLQRLYKDSKCAECSVVVTRMDFAKILGKFTKVKIQYESSSIPKGKRNSQQVSSPNSRLKKNENGMVLLHRNAYSQHPVKELSTKKLKRNEVSIPRQVNHALKENSKIKATPHQNNNILKENNSLKKVSTLRSKDSIYNNNKILINSNLKHYGIIFVSPNKNNNNDFQNKLSLTELLPCITKGILPSEQWCIDYFPKDDEPKDDKVYDRIAAELEDLMYNDAPTLKSEIKTESTRNKADDFPSIMDILNDNTADNTNKLSSESNSTNFKPNLESNDVEAMLLGKSEICKKELELVHMEIDNSDVTKLIADVHLNPVNESDAKGLGPHAEDMDNPHSPSILDVTMDKAIDENLLTDPLHKENTLDNASALNKDTDSNFDSPNKPSSIPNISSVTHVVFRKSLNGKCYKSVTCPRNLKYSIELAGKSVELLGAPKVISCLEDLEVLLQIVDETDLDSLYVLH